MDPMEWLKSLFAPATTAEKVNAAYKSGLMKSKSSKENTAAQRGVPPWLDSLYKSPVADSLYQTSGVPMFLGAINDPTVYGQYEIGFDFLRLNPDKTLFEDYKKPPRQTLIHEMGHKFDQGKSNSTPFKWQEQKPVLSKAGKTAYDKLDGYGFSDRKEAYAQAFRNAFNFLSETARDPKMDYRKFAGDLEATTPGMGLIIQDLMKLPIFAKHPLQGQIFKEAPKKK